MRCLRTWVRGILDWDEGGMSSQKPRVSHAEVRRWHLIAIPLAVLLVMALGTQLAGADPQVTSGNSANSLGKTTLDTEVGWDVGSGQIDGEFITAEVQGMVIGLRAQERFVGPIPVSGESGNRIGVYQASTGDTGGDNNATWNYDWHVDLSNATGNAEGRTLADYRLVLEQDFTTQSLFGTLGSDPVELPLAAEGTGGVCSAGTFTNTLCQQSWNPGFGNTDFDPHAEGTYHLRLVLMPDTFSGPPLAVAIQINVED